MSDQRQEFAAFSVTGPDAARFLQGQLSCDVAALAVGAASLAGLHNPQGRVIAVLHVQRTGDDRFVICLPAELAAPVVAHLRRYVLRARLALAPLPAADAAALPESLRTASARIASGIPMVFAATREHFVAQMLNLDRLGAISFDKGCYTGQEIIARAHYRGQVKRRMQHFVLPAPPQAATPGTTLELPDGRRAEIVEAVRRADGMLECLAVAAVPETGRPATAG